MVTEYLFFCPVSELFAIERRVSEEDTLKPLTRGLAKWFRFINPSHCAFDHSAVPIHLAFLEHVSNPFV